MRQTTLLPAHQADQQQHALYQNDTGQHLTIADGGQVMGTGIIAASGAGKTILESILAEQGVLRGYGQVLIDPTGSLSTSLLHRLLCFLWQFPPEEHDVLWQRLCYIPVGARDYTTPFPIYFGMGGGQSLREVAERFLTIIRMAHPSLVTKAPVSWPSMRRVGVNAGTVLAALSYQLSEAEDLLVNTVEWERAGRFAEAVKRYPAEAAPAVSYFRNQYLPMSRSEKAKLMSSFLDQVFAFHDPSLRALFGASKPGINWEEVLEQKKQTMILDFSHITDPETRRFALLWIFSSLYEHLKKRGRRKLPLGLLIDEFAALTHKAAEGTNPLAELLDEFIAQYMRGNRIFFTCCFQSLNQLPQELQQTILRLGNLVVGRAGTMTEARALADVLFRSDVYKVKHYRKVWGKVDPPPYFVRYTAPYRDYLDSLTVARQQNPYYPYYILDYEPEHMPLSEQLEVASQRIAGLPRFSFFVRPATEEGSVSEFVSKITIRQVTKDPETNEPVFPDETLIRRLKSRLAKRVGIPVATILAEQEARLKTPVVAPVPLRRGEATQRPPVKATPPPPLTTKVQLAEEQRTFLACIIDHPDTPISAVYKAVGVSVWKGNQLRDALKTHGLLVELELRRGAGRPAKVLVPTCHALELLGKEPPNGRGGAVHRHIQHLVEEGAKAKGYRTQVEKDIGTGAIVDVHVENAAVKIAVEIAVASTPERELAHINHCLAAGYDQVFGIFADEKLLARTQSALGEACSAEELSKVSLLPVSKLSGVG